MGIIYCWTARDIDHQRWRCNFYTYLELSLHCLCCTSNFEKYIDFTASYLRTLHDLLRCWREHDAAPELPSFITRAAFFYDATLSALPTKWLQCKYRMTVQAVFLQCEHWLMSFQGCSARQCWSCLENCVFKKWLVLSLLLSVKNIFVVFEACVCFLRSYWFCWV